MAADYLPSFGGEPVPDELRAEVNSALWGISLESETSGKSVEWLLLQKDLNELQGLERSELYNSEVKLDIDDEPVTMAAIAMTRYGVLFRVKSDSNDIERYQIFTGSFYVTIGQSSSVNAMRADPAGVFKFVNIAGGQTVPFSVEKQLCGMFTSQLKQGCHPAFIDAQVGNDNTFIPAPSSVTGYGESVKLERFQVADSTANGASRTVTIQERCRITKEPIRNITATHKDFGWRTTICGALGKTSTDKQ